MTTVMLPLAGLALLAAILAVLARLHRRRRPVLTGYRVRAVAAGDRCPSCREGVIRVAGGRFGSFLGCSMFKVTGCKAAWSITGERINRRNYGTLR